MVIGSPVANRQRAEIEPLIDPANLPAFVKANNTHDYHPSSTCKMGPATDSMAVVDACGKVHGIDAVFVADASIMPFVTRANTNLPTAMIGEKIAAGLLTGA